MEAGASSPGGQEPLYLEGGTFFERFNEAVEECQRLQAQCRSAAEAAPREACSVDLGAAQRSVKTAKETALYAKASLSYDPVSPRSDQGQGPPGRSPRRCATPECLKHLSDPPRETSPDPRQAIEGGLPGETNADGGARSPQDGGGGNSPPSEAVAEEGTSGVGNSAAGAEDEAPENNDPSREGSLAPDEAEETANTSTRRSVSAEKTGGSNQHTLEESRTSSKDKTSELGEDDDLDGDDDDRKWRAKPPALRFKTRMQFSSRFKPSEARQVFDDANADLKERVGAKHDEIKDPLVGWVNTVFALSINTEFEFVTAFPLLVLTVMDAVYPKRVRWERIDWRIQYKRALMRNYREVELLWQEVNMEKSREFRFDMTALRVEQLFSASLEEKMMFLRLLKRWFDTRIHHCPPYDPIRKRAEFGDACRLRGLPVTFPPWMKIDKELQAKIAAGKKSGRYRELPEYMRLICFLGSPDEQTM